MATIRIKSYTRGIPQHIIFGSDITEENWKDRVLDYLVGSQDVDYYESGSYVKYENFETAHGTCVAFEKNSRFGNWDWMGNPNGEFEFDPEP